MTLAGRNRIITASIVVSALILITASLSAPAAFSAAKEARSMARGAPYGAVAALDKRLFPQSPYAPLVASGMSGLLALLTLGYILYSFEKTQAPEMLFFALFILSLAVEPLRLTIPLAEAKSLPTLFSGGAERLILFGRIFGSAALLISSVYAYGIESSKLGASVAVVVVAGLSIATGVPVNGDSFDTAFAPWPGYRNTLEFVEVAIAIIALLSFAISAYSRSATEYLYVALGCLLVLIGRDFLLKGGSWVTLALGGVCSAVGIWLFVSKVHRYYLWL